MDSRRALQGAVVVLGGVAASTGVATMLRGTAIVRDAPAAVANVDSEQRFLAASWTALGVTLWTLAPRIEQRGAAVRGIAATVFAGGVARLLSARDTGAPHPLYRGLTAIELALPPVLVAWQRRLARRP